MREILFRAKREATNEWVYGYFVKEYDDFQIYVNSKIITKSGHEYVREDTLGQFTGLTDKNGVKVFEGDIIQTYDSDDGYAVVRYDETETEFYADFIGESAYYGLGGNFRADDIEIIGNIYDNPELIGGGENDT